MTEYMMIYLFRSGNVLAGVPLSWSPADAPMLEAGEVNEAGSSALAGPDKQRDYRLFVPLRKEK